jgi:hypothetical protein
MHAADGGEENRRRMPPAFTATRWRAAEDACRPRTGIRDVAAVDEQGSRSHPVRQAKTSKMEQSVSF